MKIAITTSGDSLAAPLDSRFGRAPRFLLLELADGSFTLVDNRQNLDAAQGAGIQAAQNLAATGARALITGHCGPKAFRVLQAAGIQVYTTPGAPTVAAAVEAYRAGRLQPLAAADVEGHWA
ncbi:MAG: NifB/NifX family molybdenum-iron cluster-binding protein [Lentisphaeria bacterium]|jgi:predicted Fe-Mo cluster-binding NifX family protein